MRKLNKDRVFKHMGRGVPLERRFSFEMDELFRISPDPNAYIQKVVDDWATKMRRAHPGTSFLMRLAQADWMPSYPGELVVFAEMIEKGERKRGTLPPSGAGPEGAWEW